jgi:glucose-1-phosphate thymidylyltransferase
MKGVILAGGSGTRLRPLTQIINKHLLPVGRYPMIYYGIQKLAEAGVNDLLIIVGKSSSGLYTELLGSGQQFGVNISFRVQESSGGIADALRLAKGFVGSDERFVLLLGDNLFEDSLSPYIEQFNQQDRGARVLLKQVDDPRRYGVPIIKKDRIVEIIEKPSDPPSHYSVTGIYMYDNNVFDIAEQLKPSDRGELEITDVNNVYANQGQLSFNVIDGWWTDAGTFESLHEASARMLEQEGEET